MVHSKQYVVECVLCRRHSWRALDRYIPGCAFVKRKQKTKTKQNKTNKQKQNNVNGLCAPYSHNYVSTSHGYQFSKHGCVNQTLSESFLNEEVFILLLLEH